MSDVFISYSRLDKVFVGQLRDALVAQNQDVWIDWEDIPPSQGWWDEIKTGIAKANNFVVVLSANSMASPICQLEIEHARNLGKRIIPVLHQDYNRDDAITAIADRLAREGQDATRDIWENRQPHDTYDGNDSELKHINYFFLRPEDDFAEKFKELFEIIQTDYDYKEKHTTLDLRAQEWERRGRDVSFLLLDVELADATAWLADSEGKQPVVKKLHREYIAASEKRTRQLRNIRRASIVGSTIAIIAIIATIIAVIIGINATSSANDARDREAASNTQVAVAATAQRDAQDQADIALAAQGEAEEQADIAATAQREAQDQADVALAAQGEAEELAATATRQVATAQGQIADLQEAATQIPPTLTQAAIIREDIQTEQLIAEVAADALLSAGDFPNESLASLNNLVDFYPEYASAFLWRGLLYEALGDQSAAVADFERALEIDPEYDDAYYSLATAYIDIGEFEAALEAASRAVEIDPEYPYYYHARGQAYASLGDNDAALADYNLAIEMEPDVTIAYVLRALLYFEIEDFDAALADAEQALALEGEYADSYVVRSIAGLFAGDTPNCEQAVEDFDTYLELGGEDIPEDEFEEIYAAFC